MDMKSTCFFLQVLFYFSKSFVELDTIIASFCYLFNSPVQGILETLHIVFNLPPYSVIQQNLSQIFRQSRAE